MISVLLIFLYMGITSYILGAAFLVGIAKLSGLSKDSHLPRLCCDVLFVEMCGLMVLTVYAEVFSLFHGVGLAANLLLLFVCAGFVIWAVIHRKTNTILQDVLSLLIREEGSSKAGRDCKGYGIGIRTGCVRSFTGYLVAGVLLLVMYAYGTSRGYLHYDTGLYHAQSIHWIESYGVVPGLANLHTRLGYNSAAFPLTALFSFAFLGGQSFHVTAGFYAMLLMAECAKVGRLLQFRSREKVENAEQAEQAEGGKGFLFGKIAAKKPALSDWVRVMGIFYLLTIFDEMISPASDYYMVILSFYVVIRFLQALENGEESPFVYAILAMLAVFNVTVKLSAVFLVILAIKPVGMLLREKKVRAILVFIGLGVAIVLPFLARNIILSGWLIYPFPSLDLFSFPWKVPVGTALAEQREIMVWGRGYTDVALYDLPMKAWVPAWFRGMAPIDKAFLLLDVVAVPGFVVLGAWDLWKRKCAGAKEECAGTQEKSAGTCECHAGVQERNAGACEGHAGTQEWYAVLAVVCSLLFWFTNAPLIRYGCVYVYMTGILFLGMVYQRIRLPRKEMLFRIVLLLFLLYKGVSVAAEQAGMWENKYWIDQKDYEPKETICYEVEGIPFYYAAEGDQTGYDAFPSSPTKAEIRLRGEGLKDGFVRE